jgi:hypothetical protein
MVRAGAAVTAAFVLAPAFASAQNGPLPQYAQYEHRLVGRVIAFEPYHLRLDRGPAVVLHRGTVIRPRGLTLQNGMPVRVYGHVASDGAFSADEIDLLPPSRPPGYAQRY